MANGKTFTVTEHLDKREDYDALQEVTAELWRVEKYHDALLEAEAKIVELEANLAGAVKLIDLAVELSKWDLNTKLRDDMIDFMTELKGQDYE